MCISLTTKIKHFIMCLSSYIFICLKFCLNVIRMFVSLLLNYGISLQILGSIANFLFTL